MGTTITVALVEDSVVWIGHVGDSRAYVLRDGRLQQLTEDHSLVAELVRSGRLSAEEAQTHPQRSVITRAVGTDADVDVDTFPIEPRPGDVFLLCSDGLTDMIDDGAIERIVAENRGDLDTAARKLVQAANRGGGEDNITVVFFELTDERIDEQATVRLPAVAGGEVDAKLDEDEEDTLTELDAVPAVDTMVIAPEQAAELRARHEIVEEPRRESRARRLVFWLTVLLAALAGLALALWGLDLW